MKFYLIVTRGKRKGLPIPITVDLFLVGSDPMCQLRNEKLGPKHCAFVTHDKKVALRDMDSGQPTIVNESVLPQGTEWALHAGDRIGVGNLEFMIQFREKPLSQRDLEEWASRCLDVRGENAIDEVDEFHRVTDASSAATSIIQKLNAIKGQVKGRLRVGVEGGVTTVRFNDTMLVDEAEIALIKSELCEQLDRSNLRILLDLKNVRRMSTAAVTMVAEFQRWGQQRGSRVALCRVRSEIEGILGVMHLEAIPRFRDKKLALASRW